MKGPGLEQELSAGTVTKGRARIYPGVYVYVFVGKKC